MLGHIAKSLLRDVKVITFDIDLTLANMDDVVDKADEAFLEYSKSKYPKLGITRKGEIMEAMTEVIRNQNGRCKNIGAIRRKVIDSYVVKAGYNSNATEELYNVWIEERRKITLVPYANELIEYLYGEHYVLGIITNGTSTISYHKKLDEKFSLFVNPDACGDSKPEKAPFQYVMNQYPSFRADQFLHVGDDYQCDVVGAKRMGWKSILITPYLQYMGKNDYPDLVVSSIQELFTLLQTQ